MPTTYRATCADLVARLRRYAADPSSAVFSNDEMQDILDRHRIPWRQLELVAAPTISAQGLYVYTDYWARSESGEVAIGDWEQGYLLQGPDWATLTPTTSDENTGHWTFNLPAPGQLPPVFITGYSYDLMGAAAECWERRAAQLSLKFDATSQGMRAARSQMYDHCVRQAERYRQQMEVSIAQLVRTDVLPDGWTGGLGYALR